MREVHIVIIGLFTKSNFKIEQIMFAEEKFLRSKFKGQFIEWVKKKSTVIPLSIIFDKGI